MRNFRAFAFALALGLCLCLLWGCSSSTSESTAGPLETETRVDITLSNDAGQPVENFPMGGAVFAAVKGLAARKPYDVLIIAAEGADTPLAGGTFTSDGSGVIPPTLLARDVGTTDKLGKGDYAVVVRDSEGTELARVPFSIVDNEDPTCYACTAEGQRRVTFAQDEDAVWVCLENLQPNAEGEVYVLPARASYEAGAKLEGALAVKYFQADDNGQALVEVWPAATKPGAFDLVVDLNNNAQWDPESDILNGYTLAAFCVQKKPLVPEERDLVVDLAGGAKIAEEGPASELGSDESLFVRAYPELAGAQPLASAKIYVVPHQSKWDDGAPLLDRSKAVERLIAAQGAIERTLVWPEPILPGAYDIVVDANEDGRYTRGVDYLDNVGSPTGKGEEEAGIVVVAKSNLVSVFGKVTDSEGKPIAGATVSCEDAADSPQITDEQGRYEFKQVLPLPITVVATAAGYARGEIEVTVEYSKKPVELRDLVLAPAEGLGSPYFPIAAGNEWTYSGKRSYSTALSGEKAAEKYEEELLVVRSVGDPDEQKLAGVTLWPISEKETAFVRAPTPEETGEQVRERCDYLEVSAENILLHDLAAKSTATFLPLTLAPDSSWSDGRLRVGDYLFTVEGKVTGTASLEVGAGKFAEALVLELTPTAMGGPKLSSSSVSGTIKLWLAQGVGEVRREVDISADVTEKDPESGQSVGATFTLNETLELVGYQIGNEQPAEQEQAGPEEAAQEPGEQPARSGGEAEEEAG